MAEQPRLPCHLEPPAVPDRFASRLCGVSSTAAIGLLAGVDRTPPLDALVREASDVSRLGADAATTATRSNLGAALDASGRR
jgi:hypothetical protein